MNRGVDASTVAEEGVGKGSLDKFVHVLAVCGQVCGTPSASLERIGLNIEPHKVKD
jgi:hypothetical protein